MKTSLTINREGHFYIRVTGENHCGTMSEFALKYHFQCKAKVKLDKRGFLFDQVNVDKFLKSQESTGLSCEKFCKKLAKQLLHLIHEENSKCKIQKGFLKLSPEPFTASITYEFKNG